MLPKGGLGTGPAYFDGQAQRWSTLTSPSENVVIDSGSSSAGSSRHFCSRFEFFTS